MAGAHDLLRNERERVSPVHVCAAPACLSSRSENMATLPMRPSGKGQALLTQINFGYLGLSQLTVKVTPEETLCL